MPFVNVVAVVKRFSQCRVSDWKNWHRAKTTFENEQ